MYLKNAVMLVAAAVLTTYIYTLKADIHELTANVQEMTIRASVCATEALTLQATIDSSNARLKVATASVAANNAKLKAWREKPPEVRYNTIYKMIPAKVRSNKDSCENTSKYIDAIRHVKFSEL